MERVSEHIHCKECNKVIMEYGDDNCCYGAVNKYYKLGVCEECVITKGIQEFTYKKQPSVQAEPTIVLLSKKTKKKRS